MGTNIWKRFDQWPPAEATPKTLHFHPGGKLSFDAPATTTGQQQQAYDEYISDPAKPVPSQDEIAPGMTRAHMTDDQRFASSRTDVLVYESEVLTEDTTLLGPFTASLNVSTSGTDSDYVVKLIDVPTPFLTEDHKDAPAGMPATDCPLCGRLRDQNVKLRVSAALFEL